MVTFFKSNYFHNFHKKEGVIEAARGNFRLDYAQLIYDKIGRKTQVSFYHYSLKLPFLIKIM